MVDPPREMQSHIRPQEGLAFTWEPQPVAQRYAVIVGYPHLDVPPLDRIKNGLARQFALVDIDDGFVGAVDVGSPAGEERQYGLIAYCADGSIVPVSGVQFYPGRSAPQDRDYCSVEPPELEPPAHRVDGPLPPQSLVADTSSTPAAEAADVSDASPDVDPATMPADERAAPFSPIYGTIEPLAAQPDEQTMAVMQPSPSVATLHEPSEPDGQDDAAAPLLREDYNQLIAVQAVPDELSAPGVMAYRDVNGHAPGMTQEQEQEALAKIAILTEDTESLQDAGSWLQQARQHMEAHDYWLAVGAYEKVLELQPDHAEAQRDVARARVLARWTAQMERAGADPARLRQVGNEFIMVAPELAAQAYAATFTAQPVIPALRGWLHSLARNKQWAAVAETADQGVQKLRQSGQVAPDPAQDRALSALHALAGPDAELAEVTESIKRLIQSLVMSTSNESQQ